MSGFLNHSNRGYQKLTVDNTSGGVSLTVPGGANYAVIRCETAALRYRDDATNPSTTDGMLMNANDTLIYDGDLSRFKAIRTGATSAVLHISYYGPKTAARSQA